MNAPRPLLSVDDALARLAAAAAGHAITATESVSTFDALGRVLAADVRSALDVPPEDNTSMDGYALRCADLPANGTVLPVSQRIPAGHVGQAQAGRLQFDRQVVECTFHVERRFQFRSGHPEDSEAFEIGQQIRSIYLDDVFRRKCDADDFQSPQTPVHDRFHLGAGLETVSIRE